MRRFGAFLSAVLSFSSAAWAGGPSWEPAGVLPAPKHHAFGVAHGGFVYAIGGPPWVNGGDQDGTVYRTDGTTWAQVTALEGMGPCIPQGGGIDALSRIIVFGGLSIDNGDTGKNKVYDPVEGPTTSLPDPGDFAEQEGFAFATDAQGRIYWIGGGGGASGGNSGVCARYDAVQNTWSTLAPLPVAVGEACACADGAGRILVFGGFLADGSARTTEVQRFDPQTGAWSLSAAADLPVAVSGARAVRGIDERIYVIGGAGPDGAIRSEVLALNLSTNSWSTAPSLAVARREFAAAVSPDGTIYVMGGRDGSGIALASTEKLATVTCPTATNPPISTEIFDGQVATVTANVSGGAPMAYQWNHDGEPLTDGQTGSGSVISGATTSVLSIASFGAADAGAYTVLASNTCGSADIDAATLSLRVPPAPPSHWIAQSLHPSWAKTSWGTCISGLAQGGYATIDTAEYLNLSRPVRWSGTAASAQDLTPVDSQGGAITDMEGSTLVGWWWWPYSCYIGGHWYTCYSRQAARWSDGGAAFTNLQVSGWEYSAAAVVRGDQVGGSATNDDASGNVWSYATLWSAPNWWWQFIHPASGASTSTVTAIDGSDQYGSINTPYPGPTVHAARWSGSSATFVDLHPVGTAASGISDAADGQQVGTTGWYSDNRATLWSGTAASATSLHPSGAIRSTLSACTQGVQFGSAAWADGDHAMIWRGNAADLFDLTPFLPPGYVTCSIADAEIRADGTWVVIGGAFHEAANRWEAMLWTGSPTAAGDLDGDGVVGFADLLLMLSAWGACPPEPMNCPADLDGDDQVGFSDLLVLLTAWSA